MKPVTEDDLFVRRTHRLLLVNGAGRGVFEAMQSRKTKSVVEPSIVSMNAYAYFSIEAYDADEHDALRVLPGLELTALPVPAPHPGNSMAEVLLRRVCPPRAAAAAYRKDRDDDVPIPETKTHEHELAYEEMVEEEGEPLPAPAPVSVSSDDRQEHEALADGHDAVAEVAEAETETLADEARAQVAVAPDAELEVIREVVSEPANPASVAPESDSDDDDDDDSDDSDSESESESESDDSHDRPGDDDSLRSQPSFFNHQPPRRSPLSRSSEGVFGGVYKGYHCTIRGCDFAASTAEHVRHHLKTASHWYLLDTGAD